MQKFTLNPLTLMLLLTMLLASLFGGFITLLAGLQDYSLMGPTAAEAQKARPLAQSKGQPSLQTKSEAMSQDRGSAVR